MIWAEETKKMMDEVQQCRVDSRGLITGPTDELIKTLDRVATTELIGAADHSQLCKMFDHDCNKKVRRQYSTIEGPSDQQLRNLRNKAGCKETNYLFAHCKECQKCFNHEEIVKAFVQNGLGVEKLSQFPEKDVDR